MDADWHLLKLAEFIKAVQLAGGTTPHVAMTARAMEDVVDPLWFAGCYALCYNWPTAEVLHQSWSRDEWDTGAFEQWFLNNRAGIGIRKERKAVFRATEFARSAESYLAYSEQLLDKPWFNGDGTWMEAYLDFTSSCHGMGRYIAIRWLEVIRRIYLPNLVMPDLRSADGPHPRKALALIYPEEATALLGGNSPAEIAITDQAAARLLLDLRTAHGVATDYYTLQSLLCEYKQALAGRQYPGKSVDTEVDYLDKCVAHWGEYDTKFWEVRASCFPAYSLGEDHGWHGVRRPLLLALRDHGLIWSDAVYAWPSGNGGQVRTADLSAPALRPGGPGALL